MDAELVARLTDAAAVLAGTCVDVAYLVGSRAGGRPRPDSDTDLALLVAECASGDERWDLQVRPPRELADAAIGELDVVILNGAPLPLQASFLRHRIVLWSRDEVRRVRYEVDVLQRYGDFRPDMVAMNRAAVAAIAREGL